MSDMDPVFSIALRERADGDVRVEALLDGARRRGARHRRNRRLMAGVGAAIAVVAVLGATTLLPNGHGTPVPIGSAPPSAAPSQAESAVAEKPRPPVAAGLEPLTSGGTVGEGRQIHLDTTDPAPFLLEWSSGAGLESMRAIRGGGISEFGYSGYNVIVASTPQKLEDAAASQLAQLPGRPTLEPLHVGTADGSLRWTKDWAALAWPARPDVWAFAWVKFHDSVPDPKPAIDAADARGAMLEVAHAIRYDRVLRCTASFHLTWAPAGTRTTGCALWWGWTAGDATMTFTVPGGGAFRVSDAGPDFQPNTTYNGRPVQDGADGSSTVVDGKAFLVEPGDSAITKDQRLRILTGVRPGPATDDPLR
ncbi:hypothetical protein ACQP00_23120 [Dactylosporangium sp. CS-047395]|uniref:hypothetical protein n=1 Tax=Dactylosporangium sp. CS-047395 TaxID=3239936 RepID=UPI003D8E5782